MENKYIEREAAKMAVVEALGKGHSPFNAIVMLPAADVRSVDKLTINAIMLLETCPEVINELAERICTKLDDAVLNGIKFCADMGEVEHD